MSHKPFESWIQDLVYNVDVGIGQRFIKLGLYVLFVVGIVVLYQASEFKGFKDAEAMDYAQLGRNLAARGRLTTQYIRPASMWYLSTHHSGKDPRIEEHPDIVHPPFYPAVLATGFKLFKPSFAIEELTGVFQPERWVVLPLCHLFSLLTGLFVFLLGRQLFDQRTAFLAVTSYYLSNVVWKHSVSGGTIPLTTFLVTAALYFTVWSSKKRSSGSGPVARVAPLALALLFCVLSFLTRYGSVVAVAVIAVYLAITYRPRGWAWAAGFVLAFLLGISPWLVRNKTVSGGVLGLAPYTALNESNMFSEDSFERTLKPKLRAGEVLHTLQAKWMRNVAAFYSNPLRTIGDGLFMGLFIATLFYRFSRDEVHWFKWCAVLGLLLLTFIAGYFGEGTMQLAHIFLPVILLYSISFFFILLDRLQFQARIMDLLISGVLVLLGALPLVAALLPPRVGIPYPPYFPPYISHVSGLLEPRELMCTDMPWATAWYGQRNSVYLPVTLGEYYEINDYHKMISGLYFTTLTRDKPYARTLATGPYRTWFPILEGRLPTDFPLTEGFPISNVDQLFLTDRVRWGQ